MSVEEGNCQVHNSRLLIGIFAADLAELWSGSHCNIPEPLRRELNIACRAWSLSFSYLVFLRLTAACIPPHHSLTNALYLSSFFSTLSCCSRASPVGFHSSDSPGSDHYC
ncbi:unnamed protein product [Pylaiella littoralis]